MSSRKINTFSSSPDLSGSENKNIKLTDQASIDELLSEFKKNDKYEHLAVVGEGGMGKVTLSRDKNTLRKVAIKTLNEKLLNNHEAIIRFTEEAQITAQLEHPNIIPVYEMGIDSNDAPFYTMKYVKGTNLKEILSLIKSNNEIIIQKFHIIELLNIFVKICDAMSFACSKGVLHRDLKPENIMIGEFGEVLIVDWGLAKTFQLTVDSERAFDESQIINKINHFIAENIDTIRSLNNVSLSMDNCLIGTPQYMAPERIVGKGGELSEVFALGTILHDILALKNMFIAQEVQEVLQKIALGDYEKMQNHKNLPHLPGGKIPSPLIAVVEKATQKKPQDRYEAITDLKHELEAYILGFATKAERAGFFRLLKLGLKRHKKISSFALMLLVAFLFISGVFIYELVHSRQDALNKSTYANLLKEASKRKSQQVIQKSKELENKVTELKSHSSIIYGNALHEVQQLNFDRALNYINYAIDLAPENKKFQLLHGTILLTLLDFDQAAETFKAIPAKSTLFAKAQDYLNRSMSLSAKIKNGSFKDDDIIQLYNFFKTRKESSSALAVLNELKEHEKYDELLTEIWILRLKASDMGPAINKNHSSILAVNGRFRVSINYSAIFDLSPLKNMPIRELRLSNCKINNIEVLKGMPLESFNLAFTRVSNLTPIKDAPLTDVKLRSNNISDISALQGMKLKSLTITNCPVQNLQPLKGMLLERLNIERTLVSDINPLKGMLLKYLNAMYTPIKNINALRNMPLKTLLLNYSSVNNISALKDIAPEILEMNDTLISTLPANMDVSRLQRLSISGTSIKNLSPIKKATKLKEVLFSDTQVTNIDIFRRMKLRSAHLTGTTISNIGPLINPDLKELHISGSYVSDISPLKNARALENLTANNCGVSDIAPLKGLPLKNLDLSGNLKLTCINPLQKAMLETLNISGTSVTNISPLEGTPLRKLELNKTPVQDISVLSSLKKLSSLSMVDSKEISSLKTLLSIKTLQNLRAPLYTKDFILLEGHPTLTELGTDYELRPKEQFWIFFKWKYKKLSQ